MPIEFRCTQCNRLLRTQDETAGKEAKCPECGTVMVIPDSGSSPAAPGEPPAGPEQPGSPPSGAGETSPFGDVAPPASGAASPFAQGKPADEVNPYASPADYTAPAQPGSAPVPGPIVHTQIDSGEVLGHAWAIYKDKMLWCIGATVIVGILNWLAGQIANYGGAAVGAAAGDEAIAITCMVLGILAGQLFALWLNIGMTLFLLKVGRGQELSMGALFQGGPYFLTALVAGILVSVIYVLGFAALIVPGVILALMLSQFLCLIVDRDAGIIESMKLSAQITQGNKLTLFVLWIVSVGLILAGVLACCVGVFFTAPLVSLLWIVAYLAMTGQPTADQLYEWQADTPFSTGTDAPPPAAPPQE